MTPWPPCHICGNTTGPCEHMSAHLYPEEETMSDHYILDANDNPLRAPAMQWAAWFQTADEQRQVARTTLDNGIEVSTVFLGLDHNFTRAGDPILWETLAFDADGLSLEHTMRRYSSKTDALAGHEALCAELSAQGAEQ